MKLFYGIILVFIFAINGFAQDSITFANSIKVTALPFLKPFTTSHAVIIGVEYERRINTRISVLERIEAGNFLNYTFLRYYNHFKDSPQDYLKTSIYVNGYHSVTSLRYYLLNGRAISVYSGLMLDMHQYFIKSDKTSSFEPNEKIESRSKLFQISPGIELGIRYVFKQRFTADINLSAYKDIYYNAPLDTYLPPQNGFWTSEDLMKFAVVNIQIGYSF